MQITQWDYSVRVHGITKFNSQLLMCQFNSQMGDDDNDDDDDDNNNNKEATTPVREFQL